METVGAYIVRPMETIQAIAINSEEPPNLASIYVMLVEPLKMLWELNKGKLWGKRWIEEVAEGSLRRFGVVSVHVAVNRQNNGSIRHNSRHSKLVRINQKKSTVVSIMNVEEKVFMMCV